MITSGVGFSYADSFLEGSLSGGDISGSFPNVVTGTNSVGFGSFNTVSGDQAFAFGENNVVTEDNGFAAGNGNSVLGDRAVAFNSLNLASGSNSAAFGSSNRVTAINTAAFGNGNNVTSANSIAFGLFNIIEGGGVSAVFGDNNLSTGSTTFMAGINNQGDGDLSATFGYLSTAQPFASFVIGQCNVLGTSSEVEWIATDPLFVIGNGLAHESVPNTCGNTHNALTVLKNGNIGIGKSNTNSAVDVEGYLELDESNGIPPPNDCNTNNERGRMKVDASATTLYVCTGNGWAFAQLIPLLSK